jgi:hypothetical protein
MGQLGQGDTQNRGDESGELGQNLPVVNIGATVVMSVACGRAHTCAVIDGAALKWYCPNPAFVCICH